MLAADEVDAVVAGDGEEPGGEGVLGCVGGELAEGFAEGFDGEVVGVDRAMGHAEEHEVDGFAIVAHKVGVGTLVALVAGGHNELVVTLCLVVEEDGVHSFFVPVFALIISWVTEIMTKKYLR